MPTPPDLAILDDMNINGQGFESFAYDFCWINARKHWILIKSYNNENQLVAVIITQEFTVE